MLMWEGLKIMVVGVGLELQVSRKKKTKKNVHICKYVCKYICTRMSEK